MTWCRSDRMFFFSDTATNNVQFSEYKTKLEHAVNWFDRYGNAKTFTPFVAAGAIILVKALQSTLDSNSSYSTVFDILHYGIPIVSSSLVIASTVAQKNVYKTAKALISSGIELNFFTITPDIEEPTDTTPIQIEDKQHKLHTDAISHRILGA